MTKKKTKTKKQLAQDAEKKAHQDAASNNLWRTKTGEEIPFADLEDSHLSNIMARLYDRGIHGMGWTHPASDNLEGEVKRRMAEVEGAIVYVEGQPFTFEEHQLHGDEYQVVVRNRLTKRKLEIEIDVRMAQPVAWSNYRGHGLSKRQAYKLTEMFLAQHDPGTESVPHVIALVQKWLDARVQNHRNADAGMMSSGEEMLHGATTTEAASIADEFRTGVWRPVRFKGETHETVAEHATATAPPENDQGEPHDNYSDLDMGAPYGDTKEGGGL